MKENVMKRFIFGSIFVTLLTISTWAQEEPKEVKFKLAADGKAQIEMAKAVGAGTWVELKTVKGAPYSATAESETIQMLTDGNRIRSKTTTNIARDSEGRTRREIVGSTPGVPAQVFINDPVSNTTYSLNPKQRTATKSQVKITVVEKRAVESEAKTSTATVTLNGAGGKMEPMDEAQRAAMGQKLRQAKEMAAASGQSVAVGGFGGGVMVRRNPGQTESLGQQTIEGVLCEGKRTTVTIPANTIGNDQPINVVSEEWYSPELQALVLTKQTDPRHGETTYRLTNIIRSEPARNLFEVPADYTMSDAATAMPMMKKRVPEEQK
jgi:hypothetical protein